MVAIQINQFDGGAGGGDGNLTLNTLPVDGHAQATGNLIGRAAVNYDDRGRAYQNIRFAVDPTTGIVGNALVDNTWYDPSSNVLLRLPAGTGKGVRHRC